MKKLANLITTKNIMLLAAAGIGLYVGNKLFSASSASANYTSYNATTTVTVDTLKNQVLETIYRGVMNPSVLLQNIEAVKSEVNNYTTQFTNLAAEFTAGRIPQSTITFYVNKISEEIAKKLSIELRPSGWGGQYGGYDGGTGYGWPSHSGGGRKARWNPTTNAWEEIYDDYSDLYSQYLKYYMMMSMMGGGGNPYAAGNYQYPQQQYYGQQQPNYGYSYGYGYQSPQMQQYYPTQNYNYYPQNTPYYGGAGGYPNYPQYY